MFNLSNYNKDLLKLGKKLIFDFFSIQIHSFKLKTAQAEFYVINQIQPFLNYNMRSMDQNI
jgi:hypothetical protein